jgi:hypothetical protein
VPRLLLTLTLLFGIRSLRRETICTTLATYRISLNSSTTLTSYSLLDHFQRNEAKTRCYIETKSSTRSAEDNIKTARGKRKNLQSQFVPGELIMKQVSLRTSATQTSSLKSTAPNCSQHRAAFATTFSTSNLSS